MTAPAASSTARSPGVEVGLAGLVRQRQVDEDGQPQPPRLRDDDPGHPARHQPVQQDDGVVGERRERLRELGPGGLAGARPRPGDGQLPDGAARLREFVAHPPVVPVAAARVPGVVDVAGDDHADLARPGPPGGLGRRLVHGHRSRS
ncbi:hypothetical protein [Actinomadura madurae]|uniref:hypothetical protein n=1 Tax=Actinomadura madurae TaxID=1993 RepID=UPI0027E2AB7C|nr:hypothetical protein [Actinomadura madurae]